MIRIPSIKYLASFKISNLLLLTYILAAGTVNGQQLSFYQEALNFELDSSHFSVSCMYFLSNSTNKASRTKIYYPYSYETSLIDSISVYNCSTMEHIKPFAGTQGHWFDLEVPALDTTVLHIKYSHAHNDSSVTYILLTTQHWKKPFVQADYTLRVKQGIEIKQLFLPPDTSWIDAPYTYYHWQRFTYMPQTDFTIDFEIIRDNKAP